MHHAQIWSAFFVAVETVRGFDQQSSQACSCLSICLTAFSHVNFLVFKKR